LTLLLDRRRRRASSVLSCREHDRIAVNDEAVKFPRGAGTTGEIYAAAARRDAGIFRGFSVFSRSRSMVAGGENSITGLLARN
jgi:hypothetical protein